MRHKCIFCEIINDKEYRYKIIENKYFIAILSKVIDTYGHTVVISKDHYKNLKDLPSKYMKSMLDIIQELNKIFIKIGYTGFNILNANGKEAQQSVQHLHVHYIPRKMNDKIDAWPKFKLNKYDKEIIFNKIKKAVQQAGGANS